MGGGYLRSLVCGRRRVDLHRWAWPISIAIGGAGIGLGVVAFVQPGDVALPGANLIALITLMVPGALVLWATLCPSSLRWFRRRN